ncbi:hypothetical protein L3Y34_012243 [Caenorhabditis briggsae]|uniref:Lipase maturation factor n=1 Tax=Caenorhabditis briggsae TaxID=6238 RepID=A0AAE8ZV83_CAEBR|nr:hypothetical protein L3Y34_012243 [Caenorhabditis briggsae]
MPILSTSRIKYTILYGQLFIILVAFSSIYPQIHGLFGERGLQPVAPMLECEEENIFQCRLPLLRFTCNLLHLSPSVGLQVLCFIGICLSAYSIVKPRWQNMAIFLILYFLYRTIYEAGGVFMYYQWDAFLLESTVYVAILAFFREGPADIVAIFGIVVLIVRVTFMTGATKLLSKCPEWWSLNALDYHFESQPMPTPLSFYAHHFPSFLKQAATLATFCFEIALPCMYMIPVIHVRYVMFFGQFLLTTLTILTTNNGFMNYNVLVLLVSMLEIPRVPQGEPFLSMLIFARIAYDVIYKGRFKIITEVGSWPTFTLDMNYESFQKLVRYYIDLLVIIIIIMLAVTILRAILQSCLSTDKFSKMFHVAFVASTVVILSVYGFIPLLRLDEKLATKTNENPIIMTYYAAANKWGVANSYGSYRQTTGKFGRPEIVIEGSHQVEGPWKEIGFKVKPGLLSKRPQFVSPGHPRLDVQMHYAAHGTYQQNPFFLSLVYHLMQNTTEVVGLIEDYPFKNRSEPMKFVRAKLYMYHYAKMDDKNWWTRDFQEEYMPAFNKGNEALQKYLTEHNIIIKKKSQFINGPLGLYLKQYHRLTGGNDLFYTTVIFVGMMLIRRIHIVLYPHYHNHAIDD